MAKSTEHRPATDADALVEEYLRRVDSGEQVDKDAFLAQHPDVAPALQSFFANEQLMRKWAADSKLPPGDTTPKDANPTMAPALDPAKLSGPTGSVSLPAMMGRYRIEKELGRGAMGSVYRAHDMELDRPVALKIPHFSSNDNPELISRFLREARSAAVLAHPNICRVYDVSEFQGTRYIAMEFIDGKPLSSFISAGSVQPKQAASVIRKLALGLAEAHKQGIIHRDLKPDNILINSKGEPVLTDFGLARATAHGSSSATQDGVILGSPAYMPPEQAAGNLSDMGPTSDVYSLGVVLYQMLTGDVPFRGSVVEVLASVLMKTPKKVREAKPEIDPALAAICDKMMSKKAADRYPSMTDVATAVNDWLKTAAATKPGDGVAGTAPSGTEPPKLADPAAKPKLGTTHSIAPKQTVSPASTKPGEGVAGTKTIAGHSARQLKDVADLVDQLLGRNDYLEAIRIIEDLPEYERTPELRTLLGEGYQLKSTVEKLERQLEKHLNVLDIPALKKCVDQLLKIKPGHPRGKEIRKALNTEGKRGVMKLRKKDGQFDAVGNVWEPWHLAAGVGIILVFGVIAYFGVTIYVKNSMQTVAIEIDDPTAVVTIDGSQATINAQGTGEMKLTLGNHTYSVIQGATTVITDGSYEVRRGEKNVLRITLKNSKPGDPKPGDGVAGTNTGNTPPLAVAPFNAAQAKAHQEAWAKHLGVPVEYTNSIGMKFRLIPPGDYLIGLTQAEVDAHIQARGDAFGLAEHFRQSAPRHKVTLTKPYYLGVYEVTQKDFQTVMGRNPSYMSPDGPGKDNVAGQDRSNAPVERLSWADCAEFCAKLSEREKLSPAYQREGSSAKRLGGNGYRLPTEAEWEAACRAGTNTVFSFGDALTELPKYGWSAAEQAQNPAKIAHPVGQLQSNPFGLYDMHGNVWEWCQDFFDLNSYAGTENSNVVDPTGPATGTSRSFRGGGLSFDGEFLRSGLRHGNSGDALDHTIGFRVLLPVEAVPKAPAAVQPVTAPAATSSLENYRGPFEIIEAKYGDSQQSADLTARMKNAAKNGQVVAFVDQMLSDKKFGGELSLKLTLNGKSMDEQVKHRRFLLLDSRPAPAVPAQGLAILDAWFGTGLLGEGKMNDIKGPLTQQIRNGAIDVDAKEFTRTLLDPANGESKVVIVRYALDGQIKTALFPEQQARITLGGAGTQSAAAPATMDEVRTAVREMIQAGMTVHVDVGGKEEKWLTVERIPAANFKVTVVEGRPTRAQFQRFGPQLFRAPIADFLVYLTLISHDLTALDLEGVGRCKNLVDLNLSATGIDDASLSWLPGLTKLQTLELRDTKVTGTSLSLASNLSNLTSLSWGANITDDDLVNLAGASQLTKLLLMGNQLNGSGLKHLANLKKLEYLNLTGQPLTDAGFRNLPPLPALASVELANAPVGDGVAQHLGNFKSLTYLHINGTKISSAGLEHIGKLTALKTLLCGGQIDDGGLAHLKNLTELLELTIYDGKVKGPGLTHLVGCTKLRGLVLYGNPIDDEGLKNLPTKLQPAGINLSNTLVSDASLPLLQSFKSIQHLSLDQTKCTAAGIAQLRQSLPKCNITGP